ncbi:MAG: hypothetical protein P8Y28_01450 [Gammaproteobacteria bacterium]|jgi:hypothetical protein
MKKYRNYVAVLVSALVVFSPTAYAETLFVIAPGVMNFNYEETDVDGSFLDEEIGSIPGITLSIEEKNQARFTFGMALGYFVGGVDYNGQILSSDPRYAGLPLSTTTNESVFSLSTYAIHPFFGDPYFSVYGNLTYKKWERDIKGVSVSGTDNLGDPFTNLYVSGLFELYKWWQFTFGISADLPLSARNQISFKGGFLRTIAPKMNLSIYTFDLQEAWGYETELGYYFKLKRGQKIGISGSIMSWPFGKSDEIAGFYEPDSKSEMKTIQLIYEVLL